jgi:hypothetical protein
VSEAQREWFEASINNKSIRHQNIWKKIVNIYHSKMRALEKYAHVSLPSREQNRGKLGKAFLSEEKLSDKLRQR